MRHTLTLRCNADALEAALASLAELAERSPELVQRFLDGLDTATQLVRVELDGLSAARAGECWTVLHPSDLLAEFLATAPGAVCLGQGAVMSVRRVSVAVALAEEAGPGIDVSGMNLKEVAQGGALLVSEVENQPAKTMASKPEADSTVLERDGHD